MSISVNIGKRRDDSIYEPEKGPFRFIDHFSKFSGLAVSQLYLVAACTIMRYLDMF